MKMIKMALLAGAALAVTAAGAQADDLTALKAQIESLNARLAAVEAAPSVPAGYQLLTISEGSDIAIPGLAETDPSYSKKATVISVMPTADAPAATEITWSGFARAAIVYTDDGTDSDIDVGGRAEIKVKGKTDTAVGEVGALVKLRAQHRDFDVGIFAAGGAGAFTSPEYWGWWAMTPELTLGGGFSGSLGNIGYGYDGACNCYYTDNADVAMNPGDVTQMRLTYASGPFTAAIALEDGDNGAGLTDGLGVAGEIKYAGDTMNGEVSGYSRQMSGAPDDIWGVGAGIGFAFDPVNLSMGAQMGHNAAGDDFWVASILGSVSLSDEIHAEVAFGHKSFDVAADVNAFLAGIYYDPVAQLTIGLEGEVAKAKGGDSNVMVDLVTVFRF